MIAEHGHVARRCGPAAERLIGDGSVPLARSRAKGRAAMSVARDR
jgi:hypothetical protein